MGDYSGDEIVFHSIRGTIGIILNHFPFKIFCLNQVINPLFVLGRFMSDIDTLLTDQFSDHRNRIEEIAGD